MFGAGFIASPASAATTPGPPALASTSPILQQTASGKWQTTVLVTGFTGACPAGRLHLSEYRLETTAPDGAVNPVGARLAARQPAGPVPGTTVSPAPVPGTPVPGTPVPGTTVPGTTVPGTTVPGKKAAGKAAPAAAGSCEVALTFDRPAAVPATATLVVAGSASLTLVVSRYLTPDDYIVVPAVWGGMLAVALLLLTLAFVRVYGRDGTPLRFWRLRGRRDSGSGERDSETFWTQRISASGAWTLNDSWATNILATAGLLGTVLGISLSPQDSPFHGLSLGRFSVLAALASGIIVAAPLLFAILYGIWSGASPGMTDDASITGASGTRICVPSGAKLVAPWGGSLVDQDGKTVPVKPAAAIYVPPGADISISDAPLAFSSGSDVLIEGSASLAFWHGNRRSYGLAGDSTAGYQIGGADEGPAQEHVVRQGLCRRRVTVPRRTVQLMTVQTGATITVSGIAQVRLPAAAQVIAPRRKRPIPLSPRRREFRWPQTANSLVGTVWMMIATALVTAFGIGAELGIAWELGTRLSDATGADRAWTGAIVIGLAVCALIYSVTAIRTTADPQPGSSMSATPGTSFTL